MCLVIYIECYRINITAKNIPLAAVGKSALLLSKNTNIRNVKSDNNGRGKI